MRVVVDTNVLISGLLGTGGPTGRIVDAGIGGQFEMVETPDLAMELIGVAARPKFSEHAIDQDRLTAIVSLVEEFAKESNAVVTPSRDPADRIVVEAAIRGRARAIVTGDRDLLDDPDLREWLSVRGIEVISPAEFDRRLNAEPPAAR